MKPCPSCGQQNQQDALYCDFCKQPFRRAAPMERSAAPEPPKVPPPARAFEPRAVALIAVGSAALGFFGHRVLDDRRTKVPTAPPVATVCPPPVTAPAPPQPEPPPAGEKASALPPQAPPVSVSPPVVMAVKPPVAALDPAPPAQPASAPQPARKRIVVPYRPLEGNASRILIAVNVNGRTEATMALDTGAPNTVISYALAERIGALREGERRLVTLTGGIGGFSLSELVILDSISIGEARSQFVPATIADLPSDAFEGLVGMDFVAGFQVEIDTANHRLVLAEQPPSPSAPAGHDESWWRRTSELFVGQRKQWESIQTAVHQRARESLAGDDELRQLIAFSETQAKEAQALAGKFERYASNNAVPREWRKQ